MKFFIYSIIFLPLYLFAQIVDPTPFANTILAEDLKTHLTILSSDTFEGREAGTEGNLKAANYIAAQFKNRNLIPVGKDKSYFQPIIFSEEHWGQLSLSVKSKVFKNLLDYYSFPLENTSTPLLSTEEVVFLGYGLDEDNYSDYKGVDVHGKVILVYAGEPLGKDSISWVTGKKAVFSDFGTDERLKKSIAAYKHGAKALLVLDPNIQKNISKWRNRLSSARLTMGDGLHPENKYANTLYVSSDVAKEIIGKKFNKIVKIGEKIRKDGKARHYSLSTKLNIEQLKAINQTTGQNVLGYIEGTDSLLKKELVIISAHYDHLGKRGDVIFHGADDDGSGTASVIEINEAFVEAKKKGVGPRRSVLTILMTAEEKGLLGSQYYVENPIFPLKNTVVDINIDMIGRIDNKYKTNPDYVYVIGADRLSSELHAINENMNKTYTNLTLDYTYNEKDEPNRYYYRSDHYNFAEKNIPIIFYFNGTHDDYHQPTDTVDKINFQAMEKRARLAFFTAWQLSNQDKRIEVDVKK